eukprot:366093-Chlamydomonas_euryale.AAC.17
MAALAWQHVHGSTCMAAHAWQHLHGSTCMAAHAWQHLHGSTCMAALAWQHMHGALAWQHMHGSMSSIRHNACRAEACLPKMREAPFADTRAILGAPTEPAGSAFLVTNRGCWVCVCASSGPLPSAPPMTCLDCDAVSAHHARQHVVLQCNSAVGVHKLAPVGLDHTAHVHTWVAYVAGAAGAPSSRAGWAMAKAVWCSILAKTGQVGPWPHQPGAALG